MRAETPPNRPPDRESSPAQAQRWDPVRYAKHGRFVADLAGPLVELLAPRSDDEILDLGCGDGALTAAIAPRCRRIVGVDASSEQVAAARGLGLDARVFDGHALPFDSEFDAIVTNAALHWMTCQGFSCQSSTRSVSGCTTSTVAPATSAASRMIHRPEPIRPPVWMDSTSTRAPAAS